MICFVRGRLQQYMESLWIYTELSDEDTSVKENKNIRGR